MTNAIYSNPKFKLLNRTCLIVLIGALIYRLMEIRHVVGDGHPYKPVSGLLLNAALLFQFGGNEILARVQNQTRWSAGLIILTALALAGCVAAGL